MLSATEHLSLPSISFLMKMAGVMGARRLYSRRGTARRGIRVSPIETALFRAVCFELEPASASASASSPSAAAEQQQSVAPQDLRVVLCT
jgi:hypothetical protein